MKEKYLDVFMRQSEFFWKFQQTVILVETALIVGWYTLLKDKQDFLAIGILGIGILVLLVLFLIIRRAGQYLNALRDSAINELPGKLDPALFGIRSSYIGVSTPVICVIFNVALLIWQIINTQP